MLLNLIILLVLFVLFIIYQSVLILFNNNQSNFQNSVKLFALIGGCLIFFNIVLNLYIYNSLMNTKGLVGPRGIEGKQGKVGDKGLCNADCGEKVCYKLVYDGINDHLKNKYVKNLKNNFLINKINKICFSEKYTSFLHSADPNKPTEKELIDYIQDTFNTWIDIIASNNKGPKFIETPEYEETYFDPNTGPFNEIKKYELWDWGEPYRFKPITRQQCALDEELPKVNAELELYFTKDYVKVYKNDEIETMYGPEDCPFNQLGEGRTNPREISSCLYDKYNSEKVWKIYEFINYKNNIGFYEPELNKINTDTKQQYYIVGTVWTGTNKEVELGKETIVVRDTGKDNLREPIEWKKIWSEGDIAKDKIIDPIMKSKVSSITIWRPVPPDGYSSLGDFVTHDEDSNSTARNNFRCIKTDLLETYQLDNTSVWDTSGFKVKNKTKITDDTTNFSQPKISIYPIGISDRNEEIQYLGHKKTQSIKLGGYNFFRISNSQTGSKSKEPCFRIKPSSYTIVKTGDPKTPDNEYGIGWLGGKMRESKYSTYKSDLKLDFFPRGIIEFTGANPNNLKYYIEAIESLDSSTKQYFILQNNKKNPENFDYMYALKDIEIEWKSGITNTNDIKNDPTFIWHIDNIQLKDNYYLVTISNNDTYLNLNNNNLELTETQNKWKLYPSTNISDITTQSPT
jgi:hypothetical protein